jgi:hypothetical protein
MKFLINESVSDCTKPDLCRIALFQDMKEEGTYTKKWDDFSNQYFSNDTTVSNLWKQLIDDTTYTKSINDFYVKFACDLVNASGDQTIWGKAVDICKPEPKPEPPKKMTPNEIIQKYADAQIDPFVGGSVQTLPNGNAYYLKKPYEDHYGREGELRYYAPDKDGFSRYAFKTTEDGRTLKNGTVKVSELLQLESVKKRKLIYERKQQDLKVINLLKLIRENHTQKKRFLNNSFLFEDGPQSSGQQKRSFEAYKKYFKIDDWVNNTDILEYIADVIIDLIGQGYKGNMFGYYRTAISLLSKITPGELGVDDPEVKSQIFSAVSNTLNTAYTKDPKVFRDPLPLEQESGQYSEVMPPTLKNYFLYNVWRDKDSEATGPSKNPDDAFKDSTYRTKSQTQEACQADLNQLYDEAIGGFRNQENYCTTQTFIDRKNYINGCYNKGFFKKSPMLFTGDEKLFYEKYSDLYRGVVVINRRNKRNAEQRPLRKECALKN